jgi:hypothetical protein
MRDFNKLFVISLPRCATVSMSQALGVLGIPIAHLGKIDGEPGSEHSDPERLAGMLLQIESNDFQFDILEHCRGLADYPACCSSVIPRLDQQYPGSLFVNVQRRDSIQRWLQSVESQFVGLELLKTGRQSTEAERQHLEVMRRFRVMTFGDDRFDATKYAGAYTDFQSLISSYFQGRGELLQFEDVSQLATDGFKRLCHFLRIDSVPEQPFPCSNAHSQLPKQAFFEALRSGKVVSQTGLG